MVNRMYRGSVEINRGRGGPRRRWRDEVREFLVEEESMSEVHKVQLLRGIE